MTTIKFINSADEKEITTMDVEMFIVCVDDSEVSINVHTSIDHAMFDGVITDNVMGVTGHTDTYVATANAAIAPVTPAPAPVESAEIEYIATAKLEFSIEQMLDAGWTHEQMLAEAMIEVVETVEPEPVAEPVAAAPPPPEPVAPPPVESAEPEMTALAGGASYNQFIENGWTHDAMVDAGYVEAPQAAAPQAPVAPVPQAPVAQITQGTSIDDTHTWPKQDGENWVDSAGVVWDAAQHSTSRTTPHPPVTAAGRFKVRRGSKSKPAAPAAPAAMSIAPSAPAAPPAAAAPPTAPANNAPIAPPISGGEDPELAALIKDWAT